MKCDLKDKIEVTSEFINELISKSWQEVEALQQQIANIDTSTTIGAEVKRLLKNACTNHYVIIGCLEALVDGNALSSTSDEVTYDQETPIEQTVASESAPDNVESDVAPDAPAEIFNFEPFEYFVDFDEPSGEPLSDKDLYG